MKCPNCDGVLAPAKHHGVDLEACPNCKGMWLSHAELEELEDKVFDLGDDEKGSLVFKSSTTTRKCPVCGQPMGRVDYRDYDLEIEFCALGHGYFLDGGEDERVLQLMREEEARLKRSHTAEEHWAGHLRHWRSRSLIDKIRELFE